MKFVFVLLLVAAAGASGYFFARQQHSAPGAAMEKAGARKVAYYQSSMHPWIKSDKPGNCTICGMKLSPVFEGEKGYDAEEGVVVLSSNQVQVLHVQAAPAKTQAVTRTILLSGITEDNESTHSQISAFVDGRIEKLFVNHIGAEVTAGQPMATLYSPMLLAAQREYLALKGSAPAANGASEAFTAEREKLVKAAAQRLRRLGLTEDQIKNLAANPSDFIEIVAPASGTVVEREAFPGKYVKEGDLLFTIADFSSIWFQFDVYEADLPLVTTGLEVEISLPSQPGKKHRGKISFIDPNLNPVTRSARARVELDNPMVKGPAGAPVRRMFLHRSLAQATARVALGNVLAVPKSAVLAAGEKAYVYVALEGGTAYERREVQVGRRGDAAVEILEGLEENEPVVTSGNLMIDAQAELEASASGGTPAAAAKGHDH